jgi:hypothetical protein
MTAVLALAVLMFAAPAARAQDPVRITMTRTACFGVCPVYTVTMRGDGSVSYEGLAHVRVTGKHAWSIDPIAVLTLARDIEKAGFFEMKDDYTALISDLPTTTVTVASGARSKTIKEYYGAPAALKEIEARIDSVSGVRGYVSADRAAIREMRAKGWRPDSDDAARWMDGALSAGDADTVKALLEAGMSARAADDNGVTLVMKAAASGDPDTVRAVLAAGGDPTARDTQGRNAADRARDGMREGRLTRLPAVEATSRPRDYAAILRLLTDE